MNEMRKLLEATQCLFEQTQEFDETNQLMEDDADTVYIEYLNKDRGFVRDKKVFSGDTAYEDAVRWARENLERFSPDMIKYGSITEQSDEDIPADPKHSHYYPVAMGTLIAHARQLSDAVKAYNKFRKPDGVDLPQDELGKINIYAVSDNQWKSVINAVNDLDDFIADHRSKGAQKIAKAGFDL